MTISVIQTAVSIGPLACNVSWGPAGMGWFLMWEETAVPAGKPRSHTEIDGNI